MCVLIAGVVAKRGSLERPPFPTNFDVHRPDPDDRLTSTPAVAGQRSPAGSSLQVGSDCSSGSVCSEGEVRF